MRADGDILLLSTYELGHQPLGLALPRAFLARAGFRPAALDLSLEPLDEAAVRRARLVAFAVPMHTALKLALAAAARVRALNPAALVVFHGLYAPLHAALLRAAGAAAVLGGECEEELVRLAEAAERGEDLSRFVQDGAGAATLRRLDFPVPSREGLPPLERYAHLQDARGLRVAGYAEATRGCLHRCRHCPIPPLYGGRLFVVPVEAVLADVAQLVAAGATHVTFGDPDFLNGPGHALRVARALHARFPAVTFDYTAKVEHLLRRPLLVAELGALGALFVTSAVESLSDRVLAKLDKGHTRADALRAFELCAETGVALRPSLLPFTPWSTLEDYLDLLQTFEERGWLPQLDPVQLSIRLLVPPGSLLLRDPAFAGAALDPAALTFRWAHPDPRMDALQAKVAGLVEERAAAGADPLETVAAVKALALAAAGRVHQHVTRARDRRFTPRLTESWFC
ncbi:CUAEP/CCAEP-tail radical SAM (seleno)protein [Anaeromyxobacter paludicola]|uniref:Radical SAM protein n=1 Tax=Anaeromyxobacter paludicola TaxID=2918171 RepID=A0ABN6N1W7_9BACT|nr:CUAEP/CCAEP-tail radical SAM protein [Anaeromyxobacter paludicola]BDG07202.1 radical SAM protein [Anaeromyxobacter paludicola]